MNKMKWIFASILLCTVTGCASDAPKDMKVLPLPAALPPVPAARAEPLDPLLRAAAQAEIRLALASTDPSMRGNAVEAAQRGMGAGARDIIITGLSDRNAFVRFSSLMAAGTLKLDVLKDRALALASDPDPKVRVAARYCLHRLGDVRLSHDLEKFATDPSGSVRSNTALVLGLLEEKSALRILRDMATDPDPDVRISVADARWRLGDEDGLEVLVSGMVSRAPDDVMLCLISMVAPKNRIVDDYVRGKLTDQYLRIALVAARCMGELGYDDGYPIAMKSVRSPDPTERILAASALGYIGRSDAQSALSTLLKDTDPKVRLATALAVLQLKA